MFKPLQELASSTGVPEANVISRGTLENVVLGFDETAGVARVLCEFPLDETRVGTRLGKKPVLKDANDKPIRDAEGKVQYGEQPITSRIYAKASNQAIYLSDPEGNVMKIAARLFASALGVDDNEDDVVDE